MEATQSVEQAGFRSGFSVEDHLLTVICVIEAATEFNLPLWVCTVDFEKAFDSVELSSLFKALLDQGIQ